LERLAAGGTTHVIYRGGLFVLIRSLRGFVEEDSALERHDVGHCTRMIRIRRPAWGALDPPPFPPSRSVIVPDWAGSTM